MELSKIKSKFRFVGIVLTIVSLIYIVYIIINYKIDFTIFQKRSAFHYVIIFVIIPVIYVFSLFIGSVIWKLILEFVGRKKLKQSEVTDVYLKSNIAKYLPGNIVQYAARNFLGAKFGWGQKEIAFSSLLEVILSTMFTLVVLLFFVVTTPEIADLSNMDLIINVRNIYIIVAVVVIIALILILWRKLRKKIFSYILTIKFKDLNIFVIKYFLLSFFGFLVSSLITVWIFYLYTDIPVSMNNVLIITGTSVIAYFLGYIAIGSPAGIGVRESIMIMLLKSVCNPGSIIIAMVILRVIGIIGDLLAYVIAFVFFRNQKKKDRPVIVEHDSEG